MLSKPVPVLAASLAVLAAGLVAASSAIATEVTPANSLMTAKLVAGTEATFTPANGTGAISIRCKESSTEGKSPSNLLPLSGPPLFNSNPHIATIPQAGGSIVVNLSTPTFTSCSSIGGLATTVSTNSTNGKWSLDGNVLNAAGAGNEWTIAALGVPKAAAAVTFVFEGKTCTLTVDPETAQSVIGYGHNGKNEVVAPKGKEASILLIDAQVFYAATAGTQAVCEAEPFKIKNEDSPAIFRASYAVENASKEGLVGKYN